MDLREFLRQLALFFPMGGNEEHKRAKIESYVELIGNEIHSKYDNFNYEALLKILKLSYDKFPTIKEVMSKLPYGKVIKESYSGREGEVIKRTINGIEYEFTIVPNHWEKVKTIEQLDNDILRRVS
jgi:hypothetical protein